MNLNFASNIIQALINWGVAEFCICAGARNLPFVEVLTTISNTQRIVFNHFDERAAAFYAIGRIKSMSRPVCVVVTSGTAAGELLPAVMEAYYSGLPLVVLTADRPKNYRGTGAPQAAEQNNLYGIYVSKCFDLNAAINFDLTTVGRNLPLHINACFDVPLLSGEITPIKNFPAVSTTHQTYTNDFETEINLLDSFLQAAKAPLIVVSQIKTEHMQAVLHFLKTVQLPVYVEAHSQLRNIKEIKHLQLLVGDRIWSNSKAANYNIDSVLKIGGTPTLRFWRDLDEERNEIKVFSISENSFSGIRGAEHILVNLNNFLETYLRQTNKKFSFNFENFVAADRAEYAKLRNLFLEYPKAEESWFNFLSNQIVSESRIFLGNSLPIRNWDMAATFDEHDWLIEASRGLNGIDGQISTFLGYASEKAQSNWGIFGDLTALYDLNALWMLAQRPELNTNIVVINNGGGMIFNRLVKGAAADFVLNRHMISFEHYAKLWGLDYQLVKDPKEFIPTSSKSRVIEVIPDRVQTINLQQEFSRI